MLWCLIWVWCCCSFWFDNLLFAFILLPWLAMDHFIYISSILSWLDMFCLVSIFFPWHDMDYSVYLLYVLPWFDMDYFVISYLFFHDLIWTALPLYYHFFTYDIIWMANYFSLIMTWCVLLCEFVPTFTMTWYGFVFFFSSFTCVDSMFPIEFLWFIIG